MRRSRTTRISASGCRSTASTCATRPASNCSRAGSASSCRASTSSSTTPARRCAGPRASSATCSSAKLPDPQRFPPGLRAPLAPHDALLGALLALARPAAGSGASRPRYAATREGLVHSAALSQRRYLDEDYLEGESLFPAGRYDEDRQQVDLRETNSWRLRLHEVQTPELLEVQLVNAIAPYILNARLKPLMMRSGARDLHIVNVSAMEGQFYRTTKTDKHPHTNMAKAALNMMTRTSAPDYVRDGIHMNAVDTGWVTDEDPAVHAARKAEQGFAPPLDIIDGAARIVDPIFSGLNTGTHVWGQFLKDYKPAPW